MHINPSEGPAREWRKAQTKHCSNISFQLKTQTMITKTAATIILTHISHTIKIFFWSSVLMYHMLRYSTSCQGAFQSVEAYYGTLYYKRSQSLPYPFHSIIFNTPAIQCYMTWAVLRCHEIKEQKLQFAYLQLRFKHSMKACKSDRFPSLLTSRTCMRVHPLHSPMGT